MGHNGEGICICKPRPGSPDSACVVDPACTAVGHERTVASVAFSSDGKRIVSWSRDKMVKIWDAGTGAQVRMEGGDVKRVFC